MTKTEARALRFGVRVLLFANMFVGCVQEGGLWRTLRVHRNMWAMVCVAAG